MQKFFVYINKLIKRLHSIVIIPFDLFFTWLIFYSNGIQFSSFKSTGTPKVNVGLGGKCVFGQHLRLNNRENANPIGRFNKCSIIVGNKGTLTIGDNVGMSSIAIVCQERIHIGNNVKLGGNVVIYDTDFHSLNPVNRLNPQSDIQDTFTKPICIEDNAFIGAHTTILKGVTIGQNSIIGACSLVSKNIPANEIWGGSPAKFIRTL